MKKNKTTGSHCALGYFHRALSYCSLSCLFKVSKSLTWLVARTNNQLYRRSRQNIHLCFSELNQAQQRRLLEQTLWHTNCNFFELAAIWHHPKQQVLGYVKSKSIAPSFNHSQKPKIIIAPHFGSWEMLNLWLSNHTQLYSLYKPARSSTLNDYVLQKRSRFGAFLAPSTTAGLRHLLKGLKQNSNVMILPDQRPAKNTAKIEARFMGYPASTSLLIKKLLEKFDCDVFVAAMLRDTQNAEYHLVIKSADVSKLKLDDIASANYLNESIEALIKEDISQYQWSYRRFPIRYYHALEHDRRHLDESKFD